MNSTLPALPANPSLTLQLITLSIITLQRTREHNYVNSYQPLNQTYDYIVVGAGTAGSIVASRLSENSSVSVLVLEAGGPQTVLTDMPSMERRILGTDVDWAYRTTPQRGAGWAYGGRVPIPRGRVVGGSHNLNYMVYSRGNRRDFDAWEQVYGAQGWSFNDVLPYFLRSENNTDPNIVSANPTYHSTNGRMAVLTPPNPDPILGKWFNLMVSNGYPVVDQNGPNQLGINWFQQTIFPNATRSTTASAYLEPYVKIRPNLQVITRAFVRQLLLNTSDGVRAHGVIFENNGTNITAHARNEVILSAGSINSPQILMLSGIGPRVHLTNLGIPVHVDLPVGHNLKDHVHVQLDYEVLNSSLVTSGTELNVENLYTYYTNSSGPLSQFPLVYQYLNSRVNQELDWPDIQVDLNMAAVGNNLSALVRNKEVNIQEWEDYYRPHLGDNNRLVILCFHYRPRSVGRLTLQSRNPHDYPLLDTNYLSDPNGSDIQALMDAIRKGMMLSLYGDFPQYAKLWRQPIPGCSLCLTKPIWECDSYLECYARTVTNTVGHQVGTCKMGNGTDSVVDERLRVRGVRALRVVDASIYPMITNGNTNAPTAMIGEYGAQMIQDDNS